jgi:hypothetical protein
MLVAGLFIRAVVVAGVVSRYSTHNGSYCCMGRCLSVNA